jgi:di/tricarboxylate transporter
MAEVILPTQLQTALIVVSAVVTLRLSLMYQTIETDLDLYLAIMYTAVFFLFATVMITAINTELERRGADHG